MPPRLAIVLILACQLCLSCVLQAQTGAGLTAITIRIPISLSAPEGRLFGRLRITQP